VSAAPDGSLYVVSYACQQIFRVRPDGTIALFAGGGQDISAPDGVPATTVSLAGALDVAVAPDGSVYVPEGLRPLVRRIGPEGLITTAAGVAGFTCPTLQPACGLGGPPTAAFLNFPLAVAVGPRGSLYIANSGNLDPSILASDPALPGFSGGEIAIPSQDARELYVFDAAGLHQSTLDTLTGAVHWQFTYDAAGRIATLTDRSGNVTTIARNGAGAVTAIVGPYGQSTPIGLDANGYVASITDPAGGTSSMIYTADGLLTQFTDPRGSASQITYTATGEMVRETDVAGGFQDLARVDGVKTYTVTRSSALGRHTSYQVDDLPEENERRIVTLPDATQDQLLSGDNGLHTRTLRDGTVIKTQLGPDPRFGMRAPIPSEETLTTPGGHVRTATSSRTVALADLSDPLSLVSLTDTLTINGATFTSVYDPANRAFTVTTPAGRHGTTVLDQAGRPVTIGIEGLTPLEISYDDRGRTASFVQGARAYTLSYDDRGRLSLLTGPLARTVGVAYDDAGRPTLLTLPESAQVARAYDAAGNLVSLTPPGRMPHVFGYTPTGLFETYTPPSVGGGPSGLQLTYNLDRQRTQQVRGGKSVTMTYDGGGRLQTVVHAADTVTIAYDGAGRPTTLTTTGGTTLTQGYDGPLSTDTAWTGAVVGAVHRNFDNRLRVSSRTVNGVNAQTFAYDADDLLTQVGSLVLARDPQHGLVTGTTLGMVTDTRTLNGFGEWDGYAATAGATPLLSMQYTRDPYGRTTMRTETIGGVTATFTYDYDTRGRLTHLAKDGNDVASYDYDPNGNRLSKTTGVTTNATYDAQDRLLSYGTTTFTYDDDGDLQSRIAGGQSTLYDYDAFGNLRGVTLPGGTQIDYVVDGHNRRVGKRVDAVKVQDFLYDGQLRIVAELDGANAIVSTFAYGSRPNVPDYLVRAGVTYRILTDELGSPRLVVDATTGTVAQRMDFDEFGNVLQDTNPGFQPFGFAGGLYDVDTKLVRFGARDYDPSIGRWTAKDPSGFRGGGPNLYAYVANDPVNLIDRTGANPEAPRTWGTESPQSALDEIHDKLTVLSVREDAAFRWGATDQELRELVLRHGTLLDQERRLLLIAELAVLNAPPAVGQHPAEGRIDPPSAPSTPPPPPEDGKPQPTPGGRDGDGNPCP